MQDQSSTASFCLSFSSYSQNNQNNYPHISTVAARVSDEEKQRNDEEENDFEFIVLPRASISRSEDKEEEEEEEESRVALPLFDLDLISKEYSFADVAPPPPPRFSPSPLVSLGKLFVEDREGEDHPSSSSSSEAWEEDEVDGASPGTYCIWKPNLPPARCKKSNSTGSSSAAEKPKWRLRNLLRRSSSDGKNSNYIFLNPPLPPPINNNKAEGRSKAALPPLHISKAKGKGQASAHEALYVRNKAMREGDKRRSYLPYRQDIVGLLTFPHF